MSSYKSRAVKEIDPATFHKIQKDASLLLQARENSDSSGETGVPSATTCPPFNTDVFPSEPIGTL